MYVDMYVRTCVCIYIHMYVRMYVRMYVCTYVLYVYMYCVSVMCQVCPVYLSAFMLVIHMHVYAEKGVRMLVNLQ